MGTIYSMCSGCNRPVPCVPMCRVQLGVAQCLHDAVVAAYLHHSLVNVDEVGRSDMGCL